MKFLSRRKGQSFGMCAVLTPSGSDFHLCETTLTRAWNSRYIRKWFVCLHMRVTGPAYDFTVTDIVVLICYTLIQNVFHSLIHNSTTCINLKKEEGIALLKRKKGFLREWCWCISIRIVIFLLVFLVSGAYYCLMLSFWYWKKYLMPKRILKQYQTFAYQFLWEC